MSDSPRLSRDGLSGMEPALGGKARIPEYLNALVSKDWKQRRSAAKHLIRLGRASLPGLIEHLDHSDPDVRARAAMALGEIGSEGAVDALAARLDDPVEVVREECVRALGSIGGEAAAHALVAALQDGRGRVSIEARWALRDAQRGVFRRLLRLFHG